ncbi:hypothetical protein SteCoe_9114 [Stentor coeruleus]|uniref:Kinesin-like protein n=1 Tax=Stentor coeruleus TaxID=5963 RepID=A0A1R2CII7_9CILI|nr:hypothetical protein SteCoe_9114 [Stentor coeruleus]
METVRVIVRSRPLNKSEKERGNYSIVQFDRKINQVAITDIKTNIAKTFAYDAVFDDTFTQTQLYDESAYPLVECTLQGYNTTIFAYGQTGCGKTYTMLGVPHDSELRGIIPNSFAHIFGCISEASEQKVFSVRCSYIEIYNEEVRDLLNYDPNTKLELREDKNKGIFVHHLKEHPVKNIADIGAAMEGGNQHRIVKQTNMNEKSSRSHAIFTIYVETSELQNGKNLLRAGKLNLVDLAGSERQKKTGAEGDRLKEAIKINLSLSALGNVINALVEGSHHVPYRDSKLTLLLQDSLGGNTKTLMIAVISPADYNYDESLSTLRYASRAKFIQNKPKINEDPKDALIRQYAQEIERLRKLVEAQENGEPMMVEKVIEKYVEVPVRKKANVEYSDDFEEYEEENEANGNRKSIKHLSKPMKNTNSNLVLAEIEETVLDDYAEKVEITRTLSKIKNTLIQGGEALDKAEAERMKAQKDYRKMLRNQKNKEKKLLEEFKKRDEEIIIKEKEYANVQEELEDLRKLKKELKIKCQAADAEVKDLNHEFEVEHEEILENYREKQIDHEFLSTVVKYILPNAEMRSIRDKSKYDEINKKWKIPAFVIQNKSAFFTKIAGAQVRDALQEKILRFKDTTILKKYQNKKRAENYYSDREEPRAKHIEDAPSPAAHSNRHYGSWDIKNHGGMLTDKPIMKKVFLQPIESSRRYMENN